MKADTVCDNDIYEKFTDEDYKSVFTETSKIISEKKEKKSVVSLAFVFRAKVYQYWGKYQRRLMPCVLTIKRRI